MDAMLIPILIAAAVATFVWGLVLVASIVMIMGLSGSAFTSDATLTSNPESLRAEQVLADNFSQADRVDDVVVIRSDQLASSRRDR